MSSTDNGKINASTTSPSQASNNGYGQQGEQQSNGENQQAHTAADDQQGNPPAQLPAPIVLSELALNPPRWPGQGFGDDDPAMPHMVATMQALEAHTPTPIASDDVLFLPSTDPDERPTHRYEQIMRRRKSDGPNYNFFLPLPDASPGEMIGKVDWSETALRIVVEASRHVARSYEGAGPVVPLSEHVDRLNATDGPVHFVRAFLWGGFYSSFLDPFTPDGVRTAAAVLQEAMRVSHLRYVLFLARRSNLIPGKVHFECHPITAWSSG